MIRKFCWLPTPVYSSKYYRWGFRWFKFVWLGDDGKHYIANIEKIKARFNSGGELLYLLVPKEFVNDPMLNQEIECYKIKCNGLNPYGLGTVGLLGAPGGLL